MENDNIDKLAALRIKCGLSQRAAAELLEIAQSTLVAWEKGKTKPHAYFYPRIADLYGCTVEYLLGIDEIPSVPPTAEELEEKKARIKEKQKTKEEQTIEKEPVKSRRKKRTPKKEITLSDPSGEESEINLGE